MFTRRLFANYSSFCCMWLPIKWGDAIFWWCKCTLEVITSKRFFFFPSPYCLWNSCAAELRKAPLPELDQRSGAGMEEQHHLQAMNLKPRGLSFMAANRNQRAFTLRKLCVRIVRSKLRKTRPRVQTDRQPRDWATVAGNWLLWQHENPILSLVGI